MDRYLDTFGRWFLTPLLLALVSFIFYFILRKAGLRQQQATGFALITPWIVGFLIFTAYPLIYSLYLSFTEYSLFGEPRWVGLDNYIRLFKQSVEFWPSVRLTLLYAALTLPIGVTGALLMAILLNNKIKGIGIYRTIYYLPAILPEVSVALLWRWMFNSESGLLNYVLKPLFSLFTYKNL